MRRVIKIILSIFSGIVLFAVTIPMVLSILLSSQTVQNWAIDIFASRAGEFLGTTVSVDRINIRLFNHLSLKGVYVEDLQGDTLVYASGLDVAFRGYNFANGTIRLGDVRLDSAKFYLQQDSSQVMNLTALLSKLKKEEKPDKKGDFRLRSSRLSINSTRFKLRKYVVPEKPLGVNYADLDVSGINMDIDNINIINDSINAVIDNISFNEKSGFECLRLSSDKAVVSGTGINLNKALIEERHSSIRTEYLALEYAGWGAFKDFLNGVTINSSLVGSHIDFKTISFFAPSVGRFTSEIDFTGKVKGPVSDIYAEAEEALVGGLSIGFSARITGLPKIEKTSFVMDIDKLSASGATLAAIFTDFTGKALGKPEEYITRLGRINLSGNFNGLINNFNANGAISADAGHIDFNTVLNSAEKKGTKIKGSLSLRDMNIGRVLAQENLGNTTLEAKIEGIIGGKNSSALTTEAMIRSLSFNGYTYSGIDIRGEIGEKHYTGYIGSSDTNLNFSLNGTFDFNGEKPLYDFALALRRADLCRLNLNNRDSISVLSCNMDIDASGTSLNDLVGEGSITGLTYAYNEDTLSSREIRFTGNNKDDNKMIAVYSDFLDLELRSKLNFYDMVPYFRSTMRRYIPSITIADTAALKARGEKLDNLVLNNPDNFYILKAQVKESAKFAGAILPGLDISRGTDISFTLNPASKNLSLILNSEYIQYGNLLAMDLNVTGRSQGDSISVFIRSEEFAAGQLYLPKLSVISTVKQNTVDIGLGFRNDASGISSMLNTSSVISTDPAGIGMRIDTRISSSRISFEDQAWRITSPRITYLTADRSIDVENFRILTAGQELSVNGKASKETTDTLRVSLSDFDLRPLSGLVDKLGYDVEGHINGSADIMAALGNRLFYVKLDTRDVKINGTPMKNSVFTSAWDREHDRIRLLMTTEPGDTVLTGGYRPDDKRYFFNANIPGVELALLQPFLNGVMEDISGKADARVVVSGVGGKPAINGRIDLKHFEGVVSYTKAGYSIDNAVIDIDNNNLFLRKSKLRDEAGDASEIEMTLRTTYLSDMTYDLRVTARKLLALNTTEKDNSLFYGKAFASGDIHISGGKRGVNIDISDARTENNSTFFMPLASGTSVGGADFITFVSPKKEVDSLALRREELLNRVRDKKTESSSGGSTEINIALEVLPNTLVQIDPVEGNTIRAKGNGLIKMRIKPSENIFSIIGDYKIDEGSYELRIEALFTDKRFTIERGSYIQWSGDPLDALINITALYRLRTSIAPLVADNNSSGSFRQNVPVNCEISLTDRLMQPTINFDVKVPSADTEIQSIVQNAMNTEEMKSTQFLYLLGTSSFYPTATSAGNNSNIGTLVSVSTGIEFLTNQISNMISSEKNKLKFGYKPRSDEASDEFDFSYSGELFQGRVTIEAEANYNTGNNPRSSTNNDNQITGDFYLNYHFGRTLRTSAFTRTVDKFDENQGLQENGVGVYYRKDFNKLRELFRFRKKSE